MEYSKDDAVEIKIKEQGKAWEEISVSVRLSMRDNAEASTICQNIADTMGKEVRWNWVWSSQGHYHMSNSR